MSSRSARSVSAGELRQVAHASRRLAEAAGSGFTRAIVPANSRRRGRGHLADPRAERSPKRLLAVRLAPAERSAPRRIRSMTTLGPPTEPCTRRWRSSPGTPLRDGIERIVRAKTGALLILGDGPDVLAICRGGFLARRSVQPAAAQRAGQDGRGDHLSADGERHRSGQRAPRARSDRADQRDRHPTPHRRACRSVDRRCRSVGVRRRWASSACTPAACAISCKRSAGCSTAPTRRCRRSSGTRLVSTTPSPT